MLESLVKKLQNITKVCKVVDTGKSKPIRVRNTSAEAMIVLWLSKLNKKELTEAMKYIKIKRVGGTRGWEIIVNPNFQDIESERIHNIILLCALSVAEENKRDKEPSLFFKQSPSGGYNPHGVWVVGIENYLDRYNKEYEWYSNPTMGQMQKNLIIKTEVYKEQIKLNSNLKNNSIEIYPKIKAMLNNLRGSGHFLDIIKFARGGGN